ncbi:hypothetical protein FOA52_005853 [Chlamydomonas sp. UWO 241]|nr:hypothetical protein FOA52_005853 [Chlamydomonas sp. UWO 241]
MNFAKATMALAVMLVIAFAGMADAQYTHAYSAYLKGKNELPTPVMTKTWGSAMIHWNATNAHVSIKVVDGVDIWGAHIHNGTVASNGPVVVVLFSFTDAVNGGMQFVSGSFSTTVMIDLMAYPGLAEMITSGSAYVNVHSMMNMGGEIRAQLMGTPPMMAPAMMSPGMKSPEMGGMGGIANFVLSIPVARGANWFLAGGGRRMNEEEATAAAAERIAAAAEDGTSLPVRLATDVVRFLYGGTGRREPADGGVVSASLLNAKPAVGGIGVEPRGGGVLRVLFTVASDAVADTVVRWRHELRRCVDSTAVFDVLSDREEAQHQALWPAFLAAKVAGKRAQFHRARLVVDGERVPAPAC